MVAKFSKARSAYTVVELMVTIVIVTILSTVLGMGFAKLLTIREQDREQGYVREYIAAICGMYADSMSVGDSLCTSNGDFVVMYRQETGGVSLETGRVTRAAYLKADTVTDPTNDSSRLDVKVLAPDLSERYSRGIIGDAALIPFKGDVLLTSSVIPMRTAGSALSEWNETDTNFVGYVATDAALGLLRVTAWYEYENGRNDSVPTNVTVRRIVRLWNRE